MEVKTVSAKDVKLSLSGKSPLPKKCLRKAMLSPYDTVRLICKDSKEIEDIMQRVLVYAKRRSNRIPWSKFKGVPKEEKRSKKEEKRSKKDEKRLKKGQKRSQKEEKVPQKKVKTPKKEEKNVNNQSISIRNELACGMNEVCSAIEKHNLASALICEDVEPAFMVNLILDLAAIHSVPILILPTLKKITLETLGFSCSCLGLKLDVSIKESVYNPLHLKIMEMVKEYDLPKKKEMFVCPRKEPTELIELSKSDCQLVMPLKEMSSSATTGASLLKLENKQARKEILPSATLKMEANKAGCQRKNRGAHPYLRPFLKNLISMKRKKQKRQLEDSGSKPNVGDGKYTHDEEHSFDEGSKKEIGVGKEALNIHVEKSSDLSHVVEDERDETQDKSEYYKPLQLC